jgi:hypothetical protein
MTGVADHDGILVHQVGPSDTARGSSELVKAHTTRRSGLMRCGRRNREVRSYCGGILRDFKLRMKSSAYTFRRKSSTGAAGMLKLPVLKFPCVEKILFEPTGFRETPLPSHAAR